MAEAIRAATKPQASGLGEGHRVCRVCMKATGRYTCPRCNTPYCSVACYKEHGTRCTESFYKAHVEDHLRFNSSTDAAASNAVKELLRTEAAQRSRDSIAVEQAGGAGAGEGGGTSSGGFAEAVEGLTEETLEKLKALDLNSSGIPLELLSPQELARFESDVAAGRLNRFLPSYRPWWEMPRASYEQAVASLASPLITEHTAAASSEEGMQQHLQQEAPTPELAVATGPPPLGPARSSLPSLSALLGSQSPSSSLRYHAIDIVYSYCALSRLYLGHLSDDAVDACSMLLATSGVLGHEECPESAALAVEGAQYHVIAGPLGQNVAFALQIGRDTAAVLQEPLFLRDAFLHVMVLLEAAGKEYAALLKDAKQEVKREDGEEQMKAQKDKQRLQPPQALKPKAKAAGAHFKQQRRTHLRLAKKLEFFAAWAMAQPQEDLTAVAAEVLEIVQSQAEVAEEGQRARELASGKPSLQSMLKVAGPSPGAAPQGSALENLKSITQRAMDRRKARRKKQRK